MKAYHPDFKGANDTALWLNGMYGAAPAWVFKELASRQFPFADPADIFASDSLMVPACQE
jgi:hypothetical protein